MKTLIAFIFTVLSTTAYAGSANCSNITHVTASGVDIYPSNSECVISIEKSISEYTVVHLPTSPSTGDEFTVEDHSPYNLDTCDPYFDEELQETLYLCYPAGVEVVSVDAPSVLVDGSNSLVMSGYYWQSSPNRQRVKFTFDGTDWQAAYSTF